MKRKKRRHLHLLSLFVCTLIFLFFSFLEHQLIPPLKEISHMQCKAFANEMIDASAAEVQKEMNLYNDSLLLSKHGSETYAANTMLINQFCSRYSRELTERLQILPAERIEIPLGAVTNYSFFANIGPKIPFTLIPMGAAKVDYTTDFISVGINQINYKIWLDVSLELKVVNPLYQETVQLERKIMLVDLVFSGKVPEQYFHITPQGEYLLTE